MRSSHDLAGASYSRLQLVQGERVRLGCGHAHIHANHDAATRNAADSTSVSVPVERRSPQDIARDRFESGLAVLQAVNDG
jgi:hypothetical protein